MKNESFKLVTFVLKSTVILFCGFLIILFVLVDPNTQCSNIVFKDTPDNYFMEENLISFNNQMRILDKNNNQIGTFIKVVDGSRTKYKYRYKDNNREFDEYIDEYVVAEIVKSSIGTETYTMTRCDGTGTTFRYETRPLSLDNIRYDLYKNGSLIGSSDEDVIVLCKSDIGIFNENDTLVAALSRSCSNSLVRDKWRIENYIPETVDNYVIGFIGYLTTLKDNQ